MAWWPSKTLGSIPAWAGQPIEWTSTYPVVRVYPRVGGATQQLTGRMDIAEGLSPRGRGNPHDATGPHVPDGSIPAWAGQPFSPTSCRSASAVYPRVGGATIAPGCSGVVVAGLSPRGRGNPDHQPCPWRRERSIPAWAGQPPVNGSRPASSAVYPRVGGATGLAQWSAHHPRDLSPRGRGNHHPPSHGMRSTRSIPAWAGQPSLSSPNSDSAAVYPRVGGATFRIYLITYYYSGLSPRGRGNRLVGFAWSLVCGSIPAWAGQPNNRVPARPNTSVYPRVGGATGPARCPARSW